MAAKQRIPGMLQERKRVIFYAILQAPCWVHWNDIRLACSWQHCLWITDIFSPCSKCCRANLGGINASKKRNQWIVQMCLVRSEEKKRKCWQNLTTSPTVDQLESPIFLWLVCLIMLVWTLPIWWFGYVALQMRKFFHFLCFYSNNVIIMGTKDNILLYTICYSGSAF